MPDLIPTYLDPTANPDGAEPVPYSALLNEQLGPQFAVEPSKSYLVRVINMAAFSQVFLHFDQHDVTIVEADGVYTEPTVVTDLYVATAQRYSILLKTKPTADKNFAILASLDPTMFDYVPDYLQNNVTGVLVYDKTKPIPVEAPPVASFNPVDEFTLVPIDKAPVPRGKPDVVISLDLNFEEIDGLNRHVNVSSTRQWHCANNFKGILQ
jgi:iron transport multicopper oxidase